MTCSVRCVHGIEFHKDNIYICIKFWISNRLEILIFSTSVTCFILWWQPLLTIYIDQMTIVSTYNMFRIHSTHALQFFHFSLAFRFRITLGKRKELYTICECVVCYRIFYSFVKSNEQPKIDINMHTNQQQRFFIISMKSIQPSNRIRFVFIIYLFFFFTLNLSSVTLSILFSSGASVEH